MVEFPALDRFKPVTLEPVAGSSAASRGGVRCDVAKFRADAIAKANLIQASVTSHCQQRDQLQTRYKELMRRFKGTTDETRKMKLSRDADRVSQQVTQMNTMCKSIVDAYNRLKNEFTIVEALPAPKDDAEKLQRAREYTELIVQFDNLVLDCKTGQPMIKSVQHREALQKELAAARNRGALAKIRDAHAGGPRQACAGSDFAATSVEYDKIPCDTCEYAHFGCYDFESIFRQRHKDVYDKVATHGATKMTFDLYDLQQALGCLDRRAQFAFWASSQLISKNLHNILINTCKKSRGALNDPSNRITESGTATSLHQLCRHLHKLGYKFVMKGNKVARMEVPGCPQFKGNLFRVEYRPNQVIRVLQVPKCIADALASSKAACKEPKCKPLVGFSGYGDAPACGDEPVCKPVPRVMKAPCADNRAGNEKALKLDAE